MSANLLLRGLILYGKHFESMYTGSMFGVGPTVFAVWGYVISHTKKDGFTELNPQLLGAVIGCPPEEIETAIEFLCSPDERSRSKDEDGRRMIREGEFDYRVVNYTSYRNILNEDERRAYNRLKKRESRARQKSKGQSLTVNEKSVVSAHTDEAVAVAVEKESTTTTTARARLREQLTPEGQSALDGLISASAQPEALIGECTMILAGERQIKPRPTPEGLSLALCDLVTNGQRPTARSIRTYTADAMRHLTEGVSTSRPGSTENAWDKAIENAKKREAKDAD
jgi:hypothetical protein